MQKKIQPLCTHVIHKAFLSHFSYTVTRLMYALYIILNTSRVYTISFSTAYYSPLVSLFPYKPFPTELPQRTERLSCSKTFQRRGSSSSFLARLNNRLVLNKKGWRGARVRVEVKDARFSSSARRGKKIHNISRSSYWIIEQSSNVFNINLFFFFLGQMLLMQAANISLVSSSSLTAAFTARKRKTSSMYGKEEKKSVRGVWEKLSRADCSTYDGARWSVHFTMASLMFIHCVRNTREGGRESYPVSTYTHTRARATTKKTVENEKDGKVKLKKRNPTYTHVVVSRLQVYG